VQTGLFGPDKEVDRSCSKQGNETFGSMKGSKEENHYNVMV
jgi:hypothetical protein